MPNVHIWLVAIVLDRADLDILHYGRFCQWLLPSAITSLASSGQTFRLNSSPRISEGRLKISMSNTEFSTFLCLLSLISPGAQVSQLNRPVPHAHMQAISKSSRLPAQNMTPDVHSSLLPLSQPPTVPTFLPRQTRLCFHSWIFQSILQTAARVIFSKH